jgi:diapolycopene oxygenase
VSEVRRHGARVTGLVAGGDFHPADIIVSNMEVIPAYEELLREDEKFIASLERRYEPACSGLVIELGADRQFPQLAHHNFFFSGDQREHFRAVFERRELPHDPTLYVVAASRTDPSVAPPGCECLKVLPHIPYIDDRRPLARGDYLALRERAIDKLEAMGLAGLRAHTVFEHVWTPLDIPGPTKARSTAWSATAGRTWPSRRRSRVPATRTCSSSAAR